MMMNEYANAKVRELEDERLNRTLIAVKVGEEPEGSHPKGKPVIGPALRLAGRTLRRAGQGLENWAEPPAPEGEKRLGLDQRTW